MRLIEDADKPILPLLSVDPAAVTVRIKSMVELHGSIPSAARLCGIPQPTLETYLRQGSMPGAVALGQICAGFGVSADWVLFGRVAK
jgi:predicted permease